MQLRHEIELTAAIVDNAVNFISGATPERQHIDNCWIYSRSRQQRWHEELKRLTTRLSEADTAAVAARELHELIEQILVSEMPTRVWTAIVTAHDQRNGLGTLEPMVRNVFHGHAEVTLRALGTLEHLDQIDRELVIAINRIRHRVERWTDLVLGLVMVEADSDDFAYDMQRATDFFEDFYHREPREQGLMFRLQTQALCRAFRHSVAPCLDAVNHRKIATCILSCFPVENFDRNGLFSSLWLTRLELTANNTQQLINELAVASGFPTNTL